MKSNHQARHLLGLNYKLSQQKKVVLDGDVKRQLTTLMPPAVSAARVNFSAE
jgi:stationary-phase-induced ribosome-associated protein